MPYAIKCHTFVKMGIKITVSIRQIDLWDWKPLGGEKIGQKNEIEIFSLYFEWNIAFQKLKSGAISWHPKNFFSSG